MSRLDTMESDVESLLRKYPWLRENDRKLYLAVLWKRGYDLNVSITNFFNDNSYPSTETVRRTRQKLQERFPELRPDGEGKAMREQAGREYLAYARK